MDKPEKLPDWPTFLAAARDAHTPPQHLLESAFDKQSGGRSIQLEAMKQAGLDYLLISTSLIKELQANQHAVVDQLRDFGVKWRELGKELETSHSAVQQRFRKPEVEEGDEDRVSIDWERVHSGGKHERRPARLVERGLMDFEFAAKIREYPSTNEFRRDHDRNHPEFRRESHEYARRLREAGRALFHLGHVEIWVAEKTAVFVNWEASSAEKRRELVELYGEDADRLRSEPDHFLERQAELLSAISSHWEWLDLVVSEALDEHGPPLEEELKETYETMRDVLKSTPSK